MVGGENSFAEILTWEMSFHPAGNIRAFAQTGFG